MSPASPFQAEIAAHCPVGWGAEWKEDKKTVRVDGEDQSKETPMGWKSYIHALGGGSGDGNPYLVDPTQDNAASREPLGIQDHRVAL